MIKAYVIIIILYVLAHAVYFCSFEISYRMVKVRPELVELRSFTNQEYNALEYGYVIRKRISDSFLYFSMLVATMSVAVLYFKLFPHKLIPKIVIAISLFWIVIIILVNGINVIPMGPTV